ncbi:Frigida-like [Dillenia turbinata]|uniref:Frigida-like n=1 Tax=Dillenia turbinata TaxID=194707 RepID=A0AAN8UQB5_9MAGN
MPISSSSSSSSLEKISSDIRLAESNKHNLGKAIEKLQAYSSEVLFVTVQWKDLQDLFDLTQASIQREFNELVTKTLQFEHRLKEFEERERSVEQRFKDCESVERDLDVRVKEFDGRVKEIRATEQRINERLTECEFKEKDLISKVKDFEAKEKVIVVKEKEVEELRKAKERRLKGIDIRDEEFKAKERKLVLDASKIEEKLNVIAKKEKEVKVLREENQKKLKQIDSKEREVNMKKLEIERIREGYEKCVKELQLKEREFEAKEKRLEELLKGAKEKDFVVEKRLNKLQSKEKEFEEKEKRFHSSVASVEERLESVRAKEWEIERLREGYEKCVKELQLKEREFEAKEKRLEEPSKGAEEKDFVVEKCLNKLQSKEKEFEEKERRFHSSVASLEERLESVRAKELEPERIREGYEKCVKELQLKEREFAAKEKRLEELLKGAKEKDFVVEKRLNKLQSKEEEFEEKEKRFHSSVASVEECLKSVRAKVDAIGKGYEKCEGKLKSEDKELDSKEKQLSVDFRLVKEQFKVVKEEEKELELAGKRVCCEKNKDENLVHKVNEDSRKQPEPMVKVKTKPREALAMNYIVDHSSPNIRFVVTMDGKHLQLFLNEREKHHALMKDEVFNALKLSSDPMELVLDAMEGFYPPHLEKGFDASVIRKSCILLLEQLMRIPRQIGPHVKEAALKLAVMWKNKMSVADDSPEVLAFLLLVCSYELAFAFAASELLLLVSHVGWYKQVVELFSRLGLAEMVVEFIDRLVEKKNWVAAVRFIGAFGLVKYPVGILLGRYIQSVKNWERRIYRRNQEPELKITALDRRLSSLRDILACIMDYKIDCQLSLEKLNNKIEELERLKEKLIVDEIFKAMEKGTLGAKRKGKATAKSNAKYVSRTPNSREPRWCQRLRKKENLRIRFAPPTAIAALPAVASFATPDAPSDSKSALCDPATAFDVKSSAAEATAPPVIAETGSQKKHDRDDAPAPTVKPQEQQQGRNKRSRTDSLAGAQISAVHNVQPLPKQQADIYVNQDNLHANTLTGKYAIRSYPLQLHMPRPHDFAYNGTQTAPAAAHPLDSIRDPGFFHTHAPPHIEPGLYGYPGSAFYKQGDEFGQYELPNPPNHHSH